MVVIFDMNTGAIDEAEGSQTAPREHINTPEPKQHSAVQLQEVESIAAGPEPKLAPLLHQGDADSFLHLMEAKPRQSR